MTPFRTVTENDVLKARLYCKARLMESGCWFWIGSKRKGYGLLQHNKRTSSAHRVAYEVFNGPIPKGLVVRHGCDNPSCINPDHLTLGTQLENVRDREVRNRRDVKGEQIGTSKLTVAEVLEIKKSSDSLDVLAERYGVDRSNVWAIRSGKSWKHLNSAASL